MRKPEPETIDPAGPSPDRARPGVVLALACGAMCLVGVDTAIVNVSLPSIQRDLGVDQGLLQWVVVAYGLVLGGFLLVGGRLADQFGRRRMYGAGMAVLTAASLIAGFSSDIEVLVAARAVQGLGAALVVPASVSLLAITFAEGPERERALGVFGGVGGAAGSVGVVASGLLAGGPGWRWSFLGTGPIGIALLALAAAFLVADPGRGPRERLDLAGAVTATSGLMLLVYALHRGSTDGWSSGATLAMFAVSALLLTLFVVEERRSKHPLVPAGVLNRRMVTTDLTALCSAGAFFSFIFICSLFMQQQVGWSPTRTGVAWLATTLMTFVAAMTGGRLAAALGVRTLLIGGAVLMTAASLLLVRVPSHASYSTDLLPSFLLAGIGFGACVPALQISALAGVSASTSGLAAGLVETMREIGGAAGVAVVSTVLVAGSPLAGFHAAFVTIAALATIGGLSAAVGLRP